MRGRFYHTDCFNREIDIRDVMAEFGYDNRTGRNISCPSPEHLDKTPSARIYTDTNTCHCFSCNRNFNPINIVEENLGCDWKDACDYLIDTFNCTDFYEDSWKESRDIHREYFPLSKTDLELLGLSSRSKPLPVRYSHDEYKDYPVILEKTTFSLRDLWKEDRNCFNAMILSKSFEALLRQKRTYEESVSFERYCQAKLDNALNGMDIEELIQNYEDGKIRQNTPEYNVIYWYFTLQGAESDLKKLNASLIRLREIQEEFSSDRGRTETKEGDDREIV